MSQKTEEQLSNDQTDPDNESRLWCSSLSPYPPYESDAPLDKSFMDRKELTPVGSHGAHQVFTGYSIHENLEPCPHNGAERPSVYGRFWQFERYFNLDWSIGPSHVEPEQTSWPYSDTHEHADLDFAGHRFHFDSMWMRRSHSRVSTSSTHAYVDGIYLGYSFFTAGPLHFGGWQNYVQVIVGNSRIAWYGHGPGRPNNINVNSEQVSEDKHQLVTLWREIDRKEAGI